ncbi:MAG: GntR family transcriptional regulator, partial [Betaproteobacteria bacterium]
MSNVPLSDADVLASDAGSQVLAPRFAPLYQQIRSLMVKRLQAGERKPGEPIPSEIELAARYRVSQGTVRKAIDSLAADN